MNIKKKVVFRLPSDEYPLTTTTTYSPFIAEQVRFQGEYAHRVLVNQQAVLRPRQHADAPVTANFPLIRPAPASRPLQQQPEQLQFLVPSTGQVRQHEIFTQQPQNLAPAQGEEPFSYAQVQFGPGPVTGIQAKGQRSVSRPRPNRVVVEPVAQQTVDYLATTVRPVQLTHRMLQNVVYIQPNGQMYKPIEETEPVVHIPRKNYYYDYQQVDETGAVTSGPAIGASSATTTTVPVEEEPLVLIPRPKKLNPSRPRPQEGRKFQRTQHAVAVGVENPSSKQAVRTEWPQRQQQKQPEPLQNQQQKQLEQQQLEQLYQQQLSSEVEPDNFLTTLLSRFQQKQQHQQEQETTVATEQKPRGGQRSSKGGDRSNASKLLPERSQLQLLQFPDELKSLSLAELKALERASAQIADHNDKSVVRQKQLLRNRQVADSSTTASAVATTTHLTSPSPPSQSVELDDEPQRHFSGNRPVPTPVELSEEQRQFLATQGIRHLYRVDYDQAGNALPLTYVLALDNRPKRAEELQ